MDFLPFWHILSTLLESVNMSECLQKPPPVSLFQQYVNNIGESSSCHPRKYKTSAILENKRLSSQDNTHQESFIKSIRYHLNRDPDRALCKIIIGRPSGVGILLTNLKRILCSKICESRWEVSQHCFQNQKIKQMFTFPPFWFWHFLPESWGVLNNLKLGKPPLSDYTTWQLGRQERWISGQLKVKCSTSFTPLPFVICILLEIQFCRYLAIIGRSCHDIKQSLSW